MMSACIAVFLCVSAPLREMKSVFPQRRGDAEKSKMISNYKVAQLKL